MVERMRLTFNGTTYGGAETFSWGVGIGFDAGGTVTGTQVQAFAQAVAGLLQLEADSPWLDEHSTLSEYTDVAVQYYLSGPTAIFSGAAPVSPVVEGDGATEQAPQVARCVSLVTGVAGRRFRGRIYLPAAAASVTSNGTAVPITGFTSSFAEFLAAIPTVWVGPEEPFIGVHSAASDLITPVIAVRTGNRLDTQRRRADNIAETYVSVAL